MASAEMQKRSEDGSGRVGGKSKGGKGKGKRDDIRDTSGQGKGKGKGKDKGKGKQKGRGDSEAGADKAVNAEGEVMADQEPAAVGPAVFVESAGVPWKLLPCEVPLAEALRTLAAAETPEARDTEVLRVLRAHPFVTNSGRPEHTPKPVLGEPLGEVREEHFKMNIRAFNRWLNTPEGRPFKKEAGGPSDDGIYTLSAVLRRCMPRGFSRFAFDAVKEEVLVRGFRKFTGLTAEDEDEESGATNMYEDFYFSKDAQASRFAVTTKSNGENGKFAVRRVAGELLFFAGSKNTCLVWKESQDIAQLNPPSPNGAVPGPLIAATCQKYWSGWDPSTRKRFADRAAENRWTLMLESNCHHHEHVFPIPQDFVEFVAILDCEGLPLPQKQAFAFFDEFHLPRVRCDEGIAIADLPARLAEERAATDREGAVLYLETEDGKPVGLLKVKSDFYVRARRTRQTLWSAIVDPLMRGDTFDESAKSGNARRRGAGTGWEAAETRLTKGMKDLKHVDGCDEHWQEWAEVAVNFVKWFRKRYEAAGDEAKRAQVLEHAKGRFGSTYRDYCRDAGLPGGTN